MPTSVAKKVKRVPFFVACSPKFYPWAVGFYGTMRKGDTVHKLLVLAVLIVIALVLGGAFDSSWVKAY